MHTTMYVYVHAHVHTHAHVNLSNTFLKSSRSVPEYWFCLNAFVHVYVCACAFACIYV